jgi:hypothetical protein
MNNAFVLIAIALISFGTLQGDSCRGKTTNSNSAVRAEATPSAANAMTPDSTKPRPPTTATPTAQRQLSGLWGGMHVTLESSEQGATLEFDCATGTIREPIVLDANGHFDVAGSYNREGPGPVRQDVQTDSSARYSGTVTGETMTLAVRLEGSSDPLLKLSLTRGKQGKIVKCY